MGNHFVAIALWNSQMQAMCNVYSCGWVGTLTTDNELAQNERDQHLAEVASNKKTTD